MGKQLIGIGIVILLFTVGLSGCVENDEPKEIKDDISTKSNQEKILGMWSNAGELGNVAYAIVYGFFSNSSFFTGLWDSNSSSYDGSVWGNYELDDEKIFFNITGGNPSNSVLKYLFSEDSNNLTLFYESEENPIVFTRFS
jgi:hypothetical protein